MKHLITKSALLSLTVLMAACSADMQEGATPDSRPLKLSFTIDSYVGDEDAETRTSLDAGNHLLWSEGDTVGIYPDKGGQVYFEMADGAGAFSASFDGGGWAFKTSSKYYSYYPFIGDIYLDRTHIPVSFVGQVQTGMDATSHIGAFAPLYTFASTANEGSLSFNYHHLGSIIRPRVTLPAGIYTKLAVTAPTEVFITSAYYDLTSESPTLIPVTRSNQLTIDLNGFVLNEEKQFLVYLMSAPVDLAGTEITVSVLDSEMNEYQFKKTPSRAYTPGYIGGLSCTEYTIATDAERLIDPADGRTTVPFEDPVFKAYMVENFDMDGDGEISFEEAESVQDIYLPTSGEKVTSLAGIEYCPHLMTLSCNNQQFEKLDVSRNKDLTYLDCSYNQFTSLDVSNNPALTYLDCSYNQFTSLDVSNNAALTVLYCYGNQLTSLDVSNNAALTYLDCHGMVNAVGENVLETIWIADGQVIRVMSLPEQTTVRVVGDPDNGGIEGIGDGGNWMN